jgi:hypothetical protein
MLPYRPTDDPTPIMPAPVLQDEDTRIICEHCGRLTRRHPIARAAPTNVPPGLVPRPCVAVELLPDAEPGDETVRMPPP